MKKILAGIVAVFAMAFAWEIASRLTSDAISMALGILFGVLACIPPTLLVLATSGRRRHDGRPNVTTINVTINEAPRTAHLTMTPPQHLPLSHDRQQQALPDNRRKFYVVGEREDWVDEEMGGGW